MDLITNRKSPTTQDSQFYVLGLPVLFIKTPSPNTPDSQSKYPGLCAELSVKQHNN